jgi:hypothetical protein
MAQQYVTDAGTLIIPGAVAQIKVEQSNSGLSTTGILMFVGEADQGADYTQEADLGANAFGPDQIGDVVAKYKSGPLVDAFRAAVAAANDPNITGSFFRAVLVKTNPSAKAAASLTKFDSTSYATVEDRSYGRLGNLINWQVTTKQAETVPTTGSFALLLPIASLNISVRVNGGSAVPLTIGALQSPATTATALDSVPGIDVSGGTSLAPVGSVTGTLALTVISGNRVQIDYSTNFQGTVPVAGDVVFVPAASVLCTAAAANAGSYIVTGSSANQILATKLLDAAGTPGQLTPPTNRAAISVASTTNDLQAYAALTIHSVTSANPIDGFGKSIEIAELTTGTSLLSNIAYALSNGVPAQVTWISKTSAPKLIVSATEYIAQLTASRQVDSITEDLSAGGQVALAVGYLGTTGQLVNDGTTLTITVSGGAGTSPAAIKLADFPTVADLATYLSSLTGFTAAPGTAVLGSQPSNSLDQGTFNIGSTFAGLTPGRIKQDAYRFYNKLKNDAILVQLHAQPAAGLPAPTAGISYLTGGTKGATSDATFSSAMDALALVRGNFMVPLFSRNASADVADGLTDAASSYTIAGIHAYSRAHVLKMSTLKARRNRQAFLSIRDTFANSKTVAANTASFRCSMAFQDVKDAGASGVKQFQPWMASVKAAAMQAAAFYRPIFRKGIAMSGVLQAAGDFNDQDDSKMEDALLAGLLPIRRDETGGFYFVSDQTTYGKDSNFVFNSIQATYVADLIAVTTAQRMEKAFVGQSVADISASLALSTLEAIMEDLRRLKLISASDDAPKGFRNAKVKISGPAMVVSIEVKLAGAIYFVPITFSITQVQQSA